MTFCRVNFVRADSKSGHQLPVPTAVVATTTVSATVSTGVRNGSAIVAAATIITTTIGRVAAIVAPVVAAVDSNVGVVRISRGDVRICIGCRITVAGRICYHRGRDVAADPDSETANTDADHHALGEKATTSQ